MPCLGHKKSFSFAMINVVGLFDYCSGLAEEAHFLSTNSLRSRKGAMTVRYWAKSAESAKGGECYAVSHRLHFLIRTLYLVAK